MRRNHIVLLLLALSASFNSEVQAQATVENPPGIAVPAIPTFAATPTPSEWDSPVGSEASPGGDVEEAPAAEEQPELPTEPVAFEPLTQEQYDIFLDAIRSNLPLKLPLQHKSQQVDSNTAGIWAGSKEKIESLGSKIVLRFRRKASELVAPSLPGDLSGDKLLESWDFTLDMKDTWLFLQHGSPARAADFEGFRARADSTKYGTRTPFIRGRRESGMYIALPSFRDHTEAWGAMVCPRRLVREGISSIGTIEYILGPSPYELSEISFNLEMKGDATMSTAGQEGRASIWLQTSGNMPKSESVFDQSISSLPRASIFYTPKDKADFFRFAPFDNVQEGALLTVEMQNQAGYLRKHKFAHVLYAKKMLEPSPIRVFAEGKKVVRDEGECYIVVMHKFSWMEYDKQPAKF